MTSSTLNPSPPPSVLPALGLRQRTFARVVQFSGAAMAVLFVMLLVNGDTGNPVVRLSLVTVGAMGLALAAAYGLYRLGRFDWACNLAVFSVMAASGVEAWIYGSLRSSGTLAIVVAVMGGAMFLERRALMAAVGLALSIFGLVAWGEANGWLAKPTFAMSFNNWLTYATVVVVVAAGVHTMRSLLQQALDKAQDELLAVRPSKTSCAGRRNVSTRRSAPAR